MINGTFNFILKAMFWITRQRINQVIDNPDSPPQNKRGETKSTFPRLQRQPGSLGGINRLNAPFHC